MSEWTAFTERQDFPAVLVAMAGSSPGLATVWQLTRKANLFYQAPKALSSLVSRFPRQCGCSSVPPSNQEKARVDDFQKDSTPRPNLFINIAGTRKSRWVSVTVFPMGSIKKDVVWMVTHPMCYTPCVRGLFPASPYLTMLGLLGGGAKWEDFGSWLKMLSKGRRELWLLLLLMYCPLATHRWFCLILHFCHEMLTIDRPHKRDQPFVGRNLQSTRH